MSTSNIACVFVRITFIFILIGVRPMKSDNACFCEDTRWCKPITKTHQNEIFIFSIKSDNWMMYDWDKITTIATVGYNNQSLLCYAHSKGARVVSLANFSPVSQLVNKTARSEWVKDRLAYMRDNLLDGVNVDFESVIYGNQTDIKAGLTALVQELSKAMKQLLPHSQLTFDFAWSPECIDSRCYDYKGLTATVDFAFIMSYDERSQIYGPCVAGANSGISQTMKGLVAYEKLGVPLKKLVLGVPWYGYVYHCENYQPQTKTCFIKQVPFRGVNCSDAAGYQAPYSHIVETLLPQSKAGRMWDEQAKSPYFIYEDLKTNTTTQVWYDDPISLKLKYQYAAEKGLLGVGMWEADNLDYTDTTTARLQREAMWGALP